MSLLKSKEIILDIPGNLEKTLQEKWFDLKNPQGDCLGYIASEGMDKGKISIFEEVSKPILTNHRHKLFLAENGKLNQFGSWKLKGKWFKEKTFFLKNNEEKLVLFGENASIMNRRNEEKTIEIKDSQNSIVAALYLRTDNIYRYQRAIYHLKITDSSISPILILGVFLALFYGHWGSALNSGE